MGCLFRKCYIFCIKLSDISNIDESKVFICRKILYRKFVILILDAFGRNVYYYLNLFKNEFNISVFYNRREILSKYEVENYKIGCYTKMYLDILSQNKIINLS